MLESLRLVKEDVCKAHIFTDSSECRLRQAYVEISSFLLSQVDFPERRISKIYRDIDKFIDKDSWGK